MPVATELKGGEMELPRHHILISGTGRAGTSLLVQLLAACGLETELAVNPEARLDEHAGAGFESYPPAGGASPYVVKSPWAYEFLEHWLKGGDVVLDALILPIRPLAEVVTSRLQREIAHLGEAIPAYEQGGAGWSSAGWTSGGAVFSLEPLDQARQMAHAFHRLVEVAVANDVPIHFLAFPRLALDQHYAFSKLKPFLPAGFTRDEFHNRFSNLVNPSMISGVAGDLTASRSETAAGSLPSLEQIDRRWLGAEIARLRAQCAALERRIASQK